MRRTDMEKSLGSKIKNKVKINSESAPFNKDSAKPLDKREQRRLDQAQGLVPFAVKIKIDLVEKIQNMAKEKGISINEAAGELLQKGLEKSE